MNKKITFCPCSSNKQYSACCGRYLDDNEIPDTAEELMRSRYTAYALQREDYVLATWHDSTRPTALNLVHGNGNQDAKNKIKWIRLEVKNHRQEDTEHAVVEFIAYYKISGRMHKLHEISQFIRHDGRWLYVSGAVE